MHGRGRIERKRKAALLELDWDKLLPTGNNVGNEEPSPMAEIKETVMEDRGEDESLMDHHFINLHSKELTESIARAKRMLAGMLFKDGGEKLRAHLKTLEVALAKRKLLENGEKCKKANPLAHETTSTGAGECSSSGAPVSKPASQSTFSLHFCSNLDNQRVSGKAKASEEELYTLNQRKNNILSSRQAPFKSASDLSVSIDDPPQSNGAQLRSQSSPKLVHTDKDAIDSFCMKSLVPRSQPLRKTRQKNKSTFLLVESDLEDDLTDDADKVDKSSKENQIYYPSRDDHKAIEICYSDLQCLAPMSYLSSTIMNFYIRYLQKPTSPTATRTCNYHVFSTYFYNKLKHGGLRKLDKEPFVKFRRWWKGVQIFEKAYIFLPIHENFHWSLVIICIPDKEDESGPIILHLDSLGMHSSKPIFNDVKSFLIEEWKFIRDGESQPELPIADKVWDNLSRRIHEKAIEVPQQNNEYDCGLFVLFFMERFIDDAPERLKKKDLDMFGRQWFKPEQASSLRSKIRVLLKEEFKNSDKCVSETDT